ncbi:MAG: molybdate ABC transporter permease subunit [Alphaproteobacteria bacterium]
MFENADFLAFLLSLRVALFAVLFGLPLSIALAWLLAFKTFKGKTALDLIIHAPLVLPPVVIGYLLLIAFSPNGFFGGFLKNTLGIEIAFTWVGAAIASLLMALPLMVRAIRLSFEAADQKLIKAARTLGATPKRAFLEILLPLAAPGILTGALLGFARALGEFGATITFVSNIPGVTQTLPLALYSATQQPGGEIRALGLLVLSLVIAFGALGASEYLARRLRKKIGGEK